MPAPAVAVGFYGKLPSRGDFVRAGLPAGFVAPWDAWLQAVLPGSRILLGERWQPAWMEAPVWRFVLRAGECGPGAVLGLWMPSVDAVGRAFPLTIAAVFASGPAVLAESWLDTAEACGRDALATDMDPAGLAACLPAACLPMAFPEGVLGTDTEAGWWTDGAPLVPAGRRPGGLPGAEQFAAMLAGPMLDQA